MISRLQTVQCLVVYGLPGKEHTILDLLKKLK